MTFPPESLEQITIRRVTARLIPFIFLCYVIAYIDRVNIGFAAAELQQDLALSDGAFGLGAGLFFLGYCLFEVPSNLILERVGARLWIARIMVGWGVAQWPYLLPTTLEVDAAAAPSATLVTVLVVFIAAAVLILPSLGLLYHLDQQNLLPEEGVSDHTT